MSNSKMELESLTPSRIDKVVKYNGSYLQWLARDKEFRTVMKTDVEAGTAVDDHWAVYIHLAGLWIRCGCSVAAAAGFEPGTTRAASCPQGLGC